MSSISDVETFSSKKDAYDLVIAGTTKPKIVRRDGVDVEIESVDTEAMYWKTQLVNNNKFSNFAGIVKAVEKEAWRTEEEFEWEVAIAIRNQLLDFVDVWKTVINAKNSETVLDGDNRQSSMVDKFMNARIERVYKSDEAMKKNLLASFFGKKKHHDDDDDD